jgi:uncharacterized membrane protein YcgQ (UPF0703/DUF1980 family)
VQTYSKERIMKKTKTVFGTGAVQGPVLLASACFICVLFVSGCKSKFALSYETVRKNATAAPALFPEAEQAVDWSGAQPAPPPPALPAEIPPGGIIEIKEKMFIAQTNDVYLNPEDYLGKGIKLEGLFKREGYAEKEYCFVIRYGPGCCGIDGNAGFEVAWEGSGEYPKVDDWVEATGVLKTYDEEGYPYLYIALSSLTVQDERGAEFVTH